MRCAGHRIKRDLCFFPDTIRSLSFLFSAAPQVPRAERKAAMLGIINERIPCGIHSWIMFIYIHVSLVPLARIKLSHARPVITTFFIYVKYHIPIGFRLNCAIHSFASRVKMIESFYVHVPAARSRPAHIGRLSSH